MGIVRLEPQKTANGLGAVRKIVKNIARKTSVVMSPEIIQP